MRYLLQISFLIGFLAGTSPTNASASFWVALVRACEAVLADQSFTPLAVYDHAPFTMGKPDEREYAVYGPSQTLVAIATQKDESWTRCLVRESKEHRAHWKEHANEWVTSFDATFPKPAYLWVTWRRDPDRPFRGAIRCEGETTALRIEPYLAPGFYFRVLVSKGPHPRVLDPCHAAD